MLANRPKHIMKNDGRHWANDELDAALERSDLDRMEIGTVFLVDPETKKLIDGIIKHRLWPAVLAGLRGSVFGVYEQKKIFDRIRTKRSQVLARELVFLIEDPIRPVAMRVEQERQASACLTFPTKSSRIWHVRGVLEARFHEYLVGFDLSLEFPEMMDVRWLVQFIMNPALAAASPNLGSDLSADEPCYVLTFSRTIIAHYGDPRLEPERIISESVRKHLDIIWAADRLADCLKDESSMSEELTERTAGLLDSLGDKLLVFYGDNPDLPY